MVEGTEYRDLAGCDGGGGQGGPGQRQRRLSTPPPLSRRRPGDHACRSLRRAGRRYGRHHGRRQHGLEVEDVAQARARKCAAGGPARWVMPGRTRRRISAPSGRCAVTTQPCRLAERLRRELRQPGEERQPERGFNSRLDEDAGGLPAREAPRLDAWNEHRRQLNLLVTNSVIPGLASPRARTGSRRARPGRRGAPRRSSWRRSQGGICRLADHHPRRPHRPTPISPPKGCFRCGKLADTVSRWTHMPGKSRWTRWRW